MKQTVLPVTFFASLRGKKRASQSPLLMRTLTWKKLVARRNILKRKLLYLIVFILTINIVNAEKNVVIGYGFSPYWAIERMYQSSLYLEYSQNINKSILLGAAIEDTMLLFNNGERIDYTNGIVFWICIEPYWEINNKISLSFSMGPGAIIRLNRIGLGVKTIFRIGYNCNTKIETGIEINSQIMELFQIGQKAEHYTEEPMFITFLELISPNIGIYFRYKI